MTSNQSAEQNSNFYGTFNDERNGYSSSPAPPTTTTTFNSSAVGSRETTILVLGACPACKIGMLKTDFTMFGICCAILLFPFGILCCFLTRQRRCDFCGSIFH